MGRRWRCWIRSEEDAERFLRAERKGLRYAPTIRAKSPFADEDRVQAFAGLQGEIERLMLEFQTVERASFLARPWTRKELSRPAVNLIPRYAQEKPDRKG